MTPQDRHPLQDFERRGISPDVIDIAQARPLEVEEAARLVDQVPDKE